VPYPSNRDNYRVIACRLHCERDLQCAVLYPRAYSAKQSGIWGNCSLYWEFPAAENADSWTRSLEYQMCPIFVGPPPIVRYPRRQLLELLWGLGQYALNVVLSASIHFFKTVQPPRRSHESPCYQSRHLNER